MPVRLTPAGPIIICWDYESQEWVSIRQTHAFPLLSQFAEVEPTTTIGDVFAFVEKDSLLKQFLSDYCSCDIAKLHILACGTPLDIFVDDIEKNSEGQMVSGKEMKADFVTLNSDGALLTDERTGETRYDLMQMVFIRSTERDIVGMSVQVPDDESEKGKFISALARLPIRLSSEMVTQDWREPPQVSASADPSAAGNDVKDDYELPLIFSATIRWTLLEVLAIIYREFSEPMFDDRYQAEIDDEEDWLRRHRERFGSGEADNEDEDVPSED